MYHVALLGWCCSGGIITMIDFVEKGQMTRARDDCSVWGTIQNNTQYTWYYHVMADCGSEEGTKAPPWVDRILSLLRPYYYLLYSTSQPLHHFCWHILECSCISFPRWLVRGSVLPSSSHPALTRHYGSCEFLFRTFQFFRKKIWRDI